MLAQNRVALSNLHAIWSEDRLPPPLAWTARLVVCWGIEKEFPSPSQVTGVHRQPRSGYRGSLSLFHSRDRKKNTVEKKKTVKRTKFRQWLAMTSTLSWRGGKGKQATFEGLFLVDWTMTAHLLCIQTFSSCYPTPSSPYTDLPGYFQIDNGRNFGSRNFFSVTE